MVLISAIWLKLYVCNLLELYTTDLHRVITPAFIFKYIAKY